jgi:hypothetical protein
VLNCIICRHAADVHRFVGDLAAARKYGEMNPGNRAGHARHMIVVNGALQRTRLHRNCAATKCIGDGWQPCKNLTLSCTDAAVYPTAVRLPHNKQESLVKIVQAGERGAPPAFSF